MASSKDAAYSAKLDIDRAKLNWLEENRVTTRRIIELLTDESVMAAQLHSTMDRSYDRPSCGRRVRPHPSLDHARS
jgi:hypothetical protein